MRSGSAVAGLLTGALLGAALAMLITPLGDPDSRDVLRNQALSNGATPSNPPPERM